MHPVALFFDGRMRSIEKYSLLLFREINTCTYKGLKTSCWLIIASLLWVLQEFRTHSHSTSSITVPVQDLVDGFSVVGALKIQNSLPLYILHHCPCSRSGWWLASFLSAFLDFYSKKNECLCVVSGLPLKALRRNSLILCFSINSGSIYKSLR